MVKWALTILLAAFPCWAQLSLRRATYPALFVASPTVYPTNYPTLGAWFLAEDVITNNGAAITNWPSRANSLVISRVTGRTNAIYHNDSGLVPHVVWLNRGSADGGGNYTTLVNANLKIGTPTASSGLTYLLFGRTSSNANVSPFWYDSGVFNHQLRLGINNTNSIGIYLNTTGDSEIQVGNALTNSNYKIMFLSWTNAGPFAYQNLTLNTIAGGINYTLTLNEIGGNFDLVEFMVWTNFAMNATQYFNLYTNYFKVKYPSAGL